MSSTPSLKIKLGGDSSEAAVLASAENTQDGLDDNDDNDSDNDSDNDDEDDDDDLFIVPEDDEEPEDIVITKTVPHAVCRSADSTDNYRINHGG
jgi:hypothetical protein